ncbi:MAG: response regulator [Nostoc sp.]|uniref:response regulator n=1 Tax=Nostoc sp. TaxID=1180 RepID=UPI002FF648A2
MIHRQALRPIEVLLVEDSPSDANLTIKGFSNAQIANNLHWVEDGESAMNYLREQEEFTRISHKFEMQRGRGAEGIELGTLNSPLLPCSPAQAQALSIGEKSGFTNVPRPDLILLDLNLPGMDGREVLTEIKSDPNLKSIPVVIITTSTDDQDILRSYNLSANCYVTKPIDVYQFIQVVQLLKDFWLIAATLPQK